MAVPPVPEYDPIVAQLLTWYDRLEGTLTEQLITATRDSWNERRLTALLAQTRGEVARLEATHAAWEREAWPFGYQSGQRIGAFHLGAMGRDLDAAFAVLPSRTLAMLAADTVGARRGLLGGILRQTQDYLRDLASGELSAGLGLGRSSGAIGRAIRDGSIEQLRGGGALQELAGHVQSATGVTYSDGSVHSLHSYADMTARTGLRRAQEEGALDRYLDAGCNLVQVPTVGTLCSYCKPWEGCLLALTREGESLGYPPVGAFQEHPNGRHGSLLPYFEDTSDGPTKRPEPWMLDNDRSEYYRRFRDDPATEELYQASRHGFRREGDYTAYKRANPDVPAKDLRGPQWRYAGIERRRGDAVADMLRTPGLSYQDAMRRQTGGFMATGDYAKQRTPVLPSAQRAAVRAARPAPVPPTPVASPPPLPKIDADTPRKAFTPRKQMEAIQLNQRMTAGRITEDERQAAVGWSFGDSTGIRKRVASSTVNAQDQQFLSFLEKAPTIQEHADTKELVTVFRGVKPQEPVATVVDRYQRSVGTKLAWAEPSSATLDPAVAEKFAGSLVFEVRSKSGRVMCGSSWSSHQQELEVVLMPGKQYRVCDVKEVVYNTREKKRKPRSIWTVLLEEAD